VNGSRKKGSIAAALVVVASLLLFGLGTAGAERSQSGQIITSLDGHLSPSRLPRHEPVPAGVHLSGDISMADGSPLPQVLEMEMALAGRGLDLQGLPVCSKRRLKAASAADSLKLCGPALIGTGSFDVEVFLPTQEPHFTSASMRIFNARRADGGPAAWAHIFAPDPPVAMVMPLTVVRRSGRFPTGMIVTLPDEFGSWPHLTHFEINIDRRFSFQGESHSYLNANCPLPAGFTVGLFPFAQVNYRFTDGQTASTTIVRGCRTL
jgi:hypothetical protein